MGQPETEFHTRGWSPQPRRFRHIIENHTTTTVCKRFGRSFHDKTQTERLRIHSIYPSWQNNKSRHSFKLSNPKLQWSLFTHRTRGLVRRFYEQMGSTGIQPELFTDSQRESLSCHHERIQGHDGWQFGIPIHELRHHGIHIRGRSPVPGRPIPEIHTLR